jgi:hypothetical protein
MGIPRCSRCLQQRAIAVIVLLVHAPRGLLAVPDRLFRAARSILTASCFVILRPGESRRNFRHLHPSLRVASVRNGSSHPLPSYRQAISEEQEVGEDAIDDRSYNRGPVAVFRRSAAVDIARRHSAKPARRSARSHRISTCKREEGI